MNNDYDHFVERPGNDRHIVVVERNDWYRYLQKTDDDDDDVDPIPKNHQL